MEFSLLSKRLKIETIFFFFLKNFFFSRLRVVEINVFQFNKFNKPSQNGRSNDVYAILSYRFDIVTMSF